MLLFRLSIVTQFQLYYFPIVSIRKLLFTKKNIYIIFIFFFFFVNYNLQKLTCAVNLIEKTLVVFEKKKLFLSCFFVHSLSQNLIKIQILNGLPVKMAQLDNKTLNRTPEKNKLCNILKEDHDSAFHITSLKGKNGEGKGQVAHTRYDMIRFSTWRLNHLEKLYEKFNAFQCTTLFCLCHQF